MGKVLYLRQNYHFGPAKISMYLKRYHDVAISSSGVWRILKRLDMSRLPRYDLKLWIAHPFGDATYLPR